MADLNRVLLIGRLTRDPELRYLPNGTPKAELRLATGRKYKDKSGEWQEDTCYVDVVVWSRQAEIASQYLAKGRQVFVEGRLDYQEWESQEGQKRSKHQVVAERVQFLDGKGGGQGGAGGGEMGEEGAGQGGGAPQQNRQRAYAPRSGGGFGGGGGGWGQRNNAGAQTYGANRPIDAPPAGAPQIPSAPAALESPPEPSGPHGGPPDRPMASEADRPMTEALGVNEDDLPF